MTRYGLALVAGAAVLLVVGCTADGRPGATVPTAPVTVPASAPASAPDPGDAPDPGEEPDPTGEPPGRPGPTITPAATRPGGDPRTFRTAYAWKVPAETVRISHPVRPPVAPPPAPPLPHLAEIHAADHPGQRPAHSRISFYFRGGFPSYELDYVERVRAEGSGDTVPLPGNAFLRIRFIQAQAHDNEGFWTVTASPGPDLGFPTLRGYAHVRDRLRRPARLSRGAGGPILDNMVDAVVVGAGVVGLTCAVRLAEAGASVLVVTADEPMETVSRIAAAVWYPTHTAADPRVLEWARRGYDVLAGQAGRGVPGVSLRPTRMLLREPVGTPWWAAAVPDLRAVEPPPGFAGQWLFLAPAAEMAFYLDWLVTRLTDLGGVLQRRRLDRLADATTVPGGPPALVVNATGLAAGGLAADPAVHPVRGMVVLVAKPGMEMSTSIRDETNPAGITYVHPRSRDVVLGGTFEPDQTDTTPDERVGRAIVERCVELEPALAGVPVLGQLVGLRPARHGGVRVAADPVGLPGGTRLIHNYGHGGAGVTLAWGCADEVVALAG